MSIIDFFVKGIRTGQYQLLKVELSYKLFNQRQFKLNNINFVVPNLEEFTHLYNEIFVRDQYDFPAVRPGAVIIDAGANIGMAMLRFKQLYPTAKICCYEPQACAAMTIQRHVEANRLKDVTINNYALSDHNGIIEFFIKPSNDSHFGAGVKQQDGFIPSTTRCNRVSDIINEHIDLFKMDVEYSETLLIKDLIATNKIRLVDNFVIEYHTVEILNELIGLLRDSYKLSCVSSLPDGCGLLYARHQSR